MLNASKKLKQKYPDYGNIIIRKNGMTEFVLKKIPAQHNNITQKLTTSSNSKTKKKK